MPQSTRRERLKKLSLAAGPPGAEADVRRLVRDELQGLGRIESDRIGSLICHGSSGHDGPRLVLDSHLDEVGFMVQSIATDGRISFVPLGGWWSHVLLGQRVTILTDDKKIPAVVGCTPPHHLSEEQRARLLPLEAMYFDAGASSRHAVEALGVRVGDFVVPDSPFVDMATPGVVCGKALDNRIGVALMIEALQNASKTGRLPNQLIGVASAQEEVGARGAITAAAVAKPDVAIVLECTPADDVPPIGEPQGRLGGGPQLRYFDPTAIGNRALVRWIETLADEQDIPLQKAVRRGGGTDAGTLHRYGVGVPTAVIGVPGRYIHSHVSMMQWSDFDAAIQLVDLIVHRLDADVASSFTTFE